MKIEVNPNGSCYTAYFIDDKKLKKIVYGFMGAYGVINYLGINGFYEDRYNISSFDKKNKRLILKKVDET